MSWVPPNKEYPPPKPGEPPLHRAARLGDHKEIQALVKAGAAVDELFDIALDPGARREPASPLMVAAGSADGASVATVRLLLQLGALPQPRPGLSALPYACRGLGWNYPTGGDAGRVAALLTAGANPDATAKNGATALALGAATGDVERVRLLLNSHANPTPECVEERAGLRMLFGFRDPLTMAAASGSAACVRLLLDAGARLDSYPDDDEQPLARATSLEVVEMLLGAGANPNHDEDGQRSVVESVARNSSIPIDRRVSMLGALRAAGASLDHGGRWATPLFSAGTAFDGDAVEVLLRAGANPAREPTALAGLCFAAFRGAHPGVDRVIELLVEAGIDLDKPDPAGLRPLHAAMAPDRFGPGYAESDGFNEPATVALLDRGVSIDITFPNTRYRPLHAAAAEGSAAVIAALLRRGADATERDVDGRTALDVAQEAGAGDCFDLLSRTPPSI